MSSSIFLVCTQRHTTHKARHVSCMYPPVCMLSVVGVGGSLLCAEDGTPQDNPVTLGGAKCLIILSYKQYMYYPVLGELHVRSTLQQSSYSCNIRESMSHVRHMALHTSIGRRAVAFAPSLKASLLAFSSTETEGQPQQWHDIIISEGNGKPARWSTVVRARTELRRGGRQAQEMGHRPMKNI